MFFDFYSLQELLIRDSPLQVTLIKQSKEESVLILDLLSHHFEGTGNLGQLSPLRGIHYIQNYVSSIQIVRPHTPGASRDIIDHKVHSIRLEGLNRESDGGLDVVCSAILQLLD